MKFYDDEIAQLKELWDRTIALRRAGNGSAFGCHHLFREMLASFGCEDQFEASSQVEYYVEYVIKHGESPKLY